MYVTVKVEREGQPSGFATDHEVQLATYGQYGEYLLLSIAMVLIAIATLLIDYIERAPTIETNCSLRVGITTNLSFDIMRPPY